MLVAQITVLWSPGEGAKEHLCSSYSITNFMQLFMSNYKGTEIHMEKDAMHLCRGIPSIPWDIRSEGGRTGELFIHGEMQLVGSQDYSVQLKFKLENSF